MIRAILRNHPSVHGVVFDQPQVIERAKATGGGDATERLSWSAGDFFEDVPKGGDIYVIKIRPPLCFSERNADALVEALDDALRRRVTKRRRREFRG